jgi:MFS family permease
MPLKGRQIRLLSTSFSLSKTGEFCFEAALTVWIISLANAELATVGLVYFFRYLPCTVCSPLAGWLADNVNRRRLLLTLELFKAATLVVLYAIIDQSAATLFIVTCLTMIFTALDCLYAPGFRALSTTLVDRTSLSTLNSRMQVIEDLSGIIGPLLFSILVWLIAGQAAFLLASMCLVVSAATIATLSATPPVRSGHPLAWRGLIRETTGTLVSLPHSNKNLFNVIACTSVCALFATSLIRFILPASVMDHFSSDAAVGYVMSLMALATVMGGLAYPHLKTVTTPQCVYRYWLLYSALFLITVIVLPLNDWVFFILLVCLGFTGAFVDIAIMTNLQLLSSDDEIGKHFSLYFLSALLGDAFSGLIASILIALAGPAAFLCTTAVLVCTSLIWNLKERSTHADHHA